MDPDMLFVFRYASQTFRREAFKKVWETGGSGRMPIAPSKLFHCGMPACRTQADVKIPDSL